MKRFLLGLGVLVVAALILSACGASVAPTQNTSVGDGKGSGGVTAPSIAPAPAPTRAAAAPAAAPIAGPAATESLKNVDSALANTATDRLIIRNGNLTLTVKDVTDSINKVTEIATAAGGYVLRTDSRYQGDVLIATIGIKVPAESFDDAMAKLKKLAIKVDVDNSTSQDVTEEFVDLDARVKVYEATEQQLLKFLEKTQNVDESLKVYRELTNVRSQIESIKGRMNYLQKSADMSNITVQLKPEEKEKPIVEEAGWNPGKVVRDALRSLVTGLQSLAELLIYVVLYILPIAFIVAVLLLIALAIWRRVRRPRAEVGAKRAFHHGDTKSTEEKPISSVLFVSPW